MKKEIGVYIHIPFCKAKCYYCDFVSYPNKEELIEKYVKAVIEEIRYKKINEYDIKTVYIGGGTPSFLDSKYIVEILNEINISENAEITIEINPGTVTSQKLEDYKKAGINRISIGLQSTEDNLLKQIGRIHTYEEFCFAYNMARKIGFKNINVDLMLGLPNQTLEMLNDTLDKVINLDPEHISVYSLILEENTKLYEMVEKNETFLPSDELERKMYWQVKEKLEGSGYIHYEISNFAKKGYSSKHNTDCWKQKEYIGIGAAAHSYLENKRFSNIESIEKYIENISNKEIEKNIIIHEIQSKEDKENEYMILGLRKLEGISINEYKNQFGQNPIFVYKNQLEKLIRQNLLEIDGDFIKLTEKGLDFANIVWEEFIAD